MATCCDCAPYVLTYRTLSHCRLLELIIVHTTHFFFSIELHLRQIDICFVSLQVSPPEIPEVFSLPRLQTIICHKNYWTCSCEKSTLGTTISKRLDERVSSNDTLAPKVSSKTTKYFEDYRTKKWNYSTWGGREKETHFTVHLFPQIGNLIPKLTLDGKLLRYS